jgi:ABC-type transporter Mla MlaB component
MSASVERPRAVIVLAAGGRRCVVAVVDNAVRCDLGLVERLLWLRLHAQRTGWRLLLEDVDDELRQLLDLVGVTTWLLPR